MDRQVRDHLDDILEARADVEAAQATLKWAMQTGDPYFEDDAAHQLQCALDYLRDLEARHGESKAYNNQNENKHWDSGDTRDGKAQRVDHTRGGGRMTKATATICHGCGLTTLDCDCTQPGELDPLLEGL